MNPTDPTSAREEAERLVATVLAAMSSAAPGWGFSAFRGVAHGKVATGDAECCVCPICRVIAAMRDPDPAFAERVATGAGDFAAGLASLLRSLSVPAPAPESSPQDDSEDVWHAATRKDNGPSAE
ncbi:hypothetical protein GCM10023263_39170 [Phytohabitans rumicis]